MKSSSFEPNIDQSLEVTTSRLSSNHSIRKVKNTKKHVAAFMNYKNNTMNGGIIRPTASELAIEMEDEKWPKIKGITNQELVQLRYGNFYQQLLPFYEVFGDENMIFLDGTNMGRISFENARNRVCRSPCYLVWRQPIRFNTPI